MRTALTAAAVAATVLGACKINLQSRSDDEQDEVDAAVTSGDADAGETRFCNPGQSNVCMQGDQQTGDYFTWLKANMFSTNCSTDDCHGATTNGQAPGGRFLLTDDMAYMNLLGKGEADMGPAPLVASVEDPNHKLVTPGNPSASYLLFILKGIRADEGTPPFQEPGESVGYMPQSNSTLCCQKLDVVRRWIEAGANP